VTTSSSAEEAVSEILTERFGKSASSYTDFETGISRVSIFFETKPLFPRRERQALAGALARLKEYGLESGPAALSLERIRNRDWAESWKRHFKALEIGPRLLIKPGWVRRRARKGQAVVVLDPGLSFGTGNHPTTEFCLRALAAGRKTGQRQSFWDVGTGSGILAIAAAKAATGVDWPDVDSALLMDVDGVTEECEHTSAVAVELARKAGALEIRVPRDAAERELMWKGRKSAFAAVGRIARNYLVQDGVIPRSEIARVLQEIAQLGERFGLRVANVFHAGDGNLHPLVLFDGRDPAEEKKAEEMSGEILRICLKHGGSITGEHGVGADKAPYMGEMFTEQDLETMQLVRCAFDPAGSFNPGKVFPSPRLCGDRPGLYQPHPTELSGEAWRA